MLQYSVCSFDIFVEEVFTSLLNGAALAIPADEDKADIHALMAFVERHHVTMISGFPYLLAEMNHLSVIPSSLRLLISGGDVLRGVYVDHLLNKAEVYNTYGPSETTVCASYYRCNSGTVLEDGTYPIGHPVLGAQIRILDQSGNEVAKGQTGEICIYGGGVSLGYIGDHAEENRAFERQPDGSTMYRSGDLGYILPREGIVGVGRIVLVQFFAAGDGGKQFCRLLERFAVHGEEVIVHVVCAAKMRHFLGAERALRAGAYQCFQVDGAVKHRKSCQCKQDKK